MIAETGGPSRPSLEPGARDAYATLTDDQKNALRKAFVAPGGMTAEEKLHLESIPSDTQRQANQVIADEFHNRYVGPSREDVMRQWLNELAGWQNRAHDVFD